ncbi:Terpenoid cyclases/protein prenyltransferase alpha-alpha toroid [Penicillium cf. griseofulvum]|uniref:Terpenoid cyclases/protein prenyltransferase alpha-alpha toroid n=1 Tax=Penicillium cf. griseofulvum TaxID=2972120 RepID=A0A9W9IT89_9EURO|nr:Terpenoid cyclases/protein prenyltransferase alpha-alpha toroid [Penicillium cf. griseofulvum]KAJ5430480.1 Terpenoid cyclases/protein prenyltransferase alpha-alpha toroid [Penicillium cf. griseofulvum]KAJ5435749.1 Terpenoid cyclases/protein prenyltransferase alpha-alpha toroid [Penicillium cf. griseofulvum]
MTDPNPTFNTERHVKYYLRCLKTFLPSAYTSNDSNRMLLAYLTLSGLDVLGILQSKTTPEERQGYIDWLYHCQVPSGGFRGFPGTDFGPGKRNKDNEAWDPANVPATFFALVNLLILGDDLSRVKRRECLEWLPQVQRADGSFGELVGPEGSVEGARDLRYCCCAAGIRYVLRGRNETGLEGVPDIDVLGFVSFIQACQTYDGGMAESPFCESHSGHTYCAVGSLDFLRRTSNDLTTVPLLSAGCNQFEALITWLASRQTAQLEEPQEDEDDEQVEVTETGSLDDRVRGLPNIQPIKADTISCAGFNGRCNKYADTCYSFWNGATLMMLDRYSVVDEVRNRRYLLEKTQHLVGGFGKGPGDPPDLLHSYFGMVSLAFQGEAGLSPVDPAMGSSERTVRHLESLPWWR